MGMGIGPGRRERLMNRKERQQGRVNSLKVKQAEQNKKNMKGAPGCETFDEAKNAMKKKLPNEKSPNNFLYDKPSEGGNKKFKDTKLGKTIKNIGKGIDTMRVKSGERKVQRTQRKINKLDTRIKQREENKENRIANRTARKEVRIANRTARQETRMENKARRQSMRRGPKKIKGDF